jgi:signal peptidase I
LRRTPAAALAKTEAASDSKPRRKVSRLRYAISIAMLGVVGLAYVGLASGRIGNYEVISNSMAPTLVKGDRVLVDQRLHYSPAIGDVVVLADPQNSGELLTKRVAAAAGQTVEVVDGYFMVDGKKWMPSDLPPTALSSDRQLQRTIIGEDEFFLVGDNIDNSEDSLAFGPVSARSVKGRLLFTYWPPARIGRIR